MPMASMPSKLRHTIKGTLADLTKAWKQRSLHLTCPCCRGEGYHALRGFLTIPRHLFKYFLNPLHLFDRALLEEHWAMMRAFHQEERLQQRHERFLWDREFASAGICRTHSQRFIRYVQHKGFCADCLKGDV